MILIHWCTIDISEMSRPSLVNSAAHPSDFSWELFIWSYSAHGILQSSVSPRPVMFDKGFATWMLVGAHSLPVMSWFLNKYFAQFCFWPCSFLQVFSTRIRLDGGLGLLQNKEKQGKVKEIIDVRLAHFHAYIDKLILLFSSEYFAMFRSFHAATTIYPRSLGVG